MTGDFLRTIANCLKIQQFIIKPDCVKVTEIQDFLKSIMGAIYIDGKSMGPVKNSIVELCRQFEKNKIKSCDVRLPCAWMTCKI